MTTIYIVSFYANITKIGIHCRFSQSKPDKKIMLLYEKIVLIRCCKRISSRVLNTIITDEIVISYTDDIIILLIFIFTGLCGYQITSSLSTNKQRHRILLLKMGIHVAPIHLYVMLSFGNILRD